MTTTQIEIDNFFGRIVASIGVPKDLDLGSCHLLNAMTALSPALMNVCHVRR